MPDRNELTLEKLKVSERLEKLEESTTTLNKSVNDISSVLFGEKGEEGVVHQLREINKLVVGAKQLMAKIFYAILGLIGVASFPYLIEALHSITKVKP